MIEMKFIYTLSLSTEDNAEQPSIFHSHSCKKRSLCKCLHVDFISLKLVLKKTVSVLEDSLHCHQQKPSLVCPFAYLLSLVLHLEAATEGNNPPKIKLSIQAICTSSQKESRSRQPKQGATKQLYHHKEKGIYILASVNTRALLPC